MEVNYKLGKIRELAGGDEDFIAAIAAAFIDEVPESILLIEEGIEKKDFVQVYQNAHKIKPTIQLFDLAIYDEVIVLQDWGKFEQSAKDVSVEFQKTKAVIKAVVVELTSDYKL